MKLHGWPCEIISDGDAIFIFYSLLLHVKLLNGLSHYWSRIN